MCAVRDSCFAVQALLWPDKAMLDANKYQKMLRESESESSGRPRHDAKPHPKEAKEEKQGEEQLSGWRPGKDPQLEAGDLLPLDFDERFEGGSKEQRLYDMADTASCLACIAFCPDNR